MSHLDDHIVIALFVRIINLVEYFCRMSQIVSVSKDLEDNTNYYDKVSDALNELEREKALFNCLEIPDDRVRLAVVKCLFVVPLDDFDIDEVDKIVSIPGTVKDIGEGETELVLSTIYWILAKFVLQPIQKPDCS